MGTRIAADARNLRAALIEIAAAHAPTIAVQLVAYGDDGLATGIIEGAAAEETPTHGALLTGAGKLPAAILRWLVDQLAAGAFEIELTPEVREAELLAAGVAPMDAAVIANNARIDAALAERGLR